MTVTSVVCVLRVIWVLRPSVICVLRVATEARLRATNVSRGPDTFEARLFATNVSRGPDATDASERAMVRFVSDMWHMSHL